MVLKIVNSICDTEGGRGTKVADVVYSLAKPVNSGRTRSLDMEGGLEGRSFREELGVYSVILEVFNENVNDNARRFLMVDVEIPQSQFPYCHCHFHLTCLSVFSWSNRQ